MKDQRAIAAEALGTALLLAAVVGSGIMAERLAGGNVALALLANAIATGGALYALIVMFGPVSGAHFNPIVTLALTAAGLSERRRALPFVVALARLFCDIEACRCLEPEATGALAEEIGRLVSEDGAVALAGEPVGLVGQREVALGPDQRDLVGHARADAGRQVDERGVDGVGGHHAVGRVLAAGDGDQAGLRPGDGVLARQARGRLALAAEQRAERRVNFPRILLQPNLLPFVTLNPARGGRVVDA